MEKLKELRKKMNKSQQQVAADLNLNFYTYQNYELGRRQPDIETLKSLADYFNTTIDNIVGHSTKHFVDISTLSNAQLVLIEKIKNSTEAVCNSVSAYIDGLKTKI